MRAVTSGLRAEKKPVSRLSGIVNYAGTNVKLKG